MEKSQKRCFYNIQSRVFVVKYSYKKITDFFLILFIIITGKECFFENEHKKIIGTYYKSSERK